MTARVWVAEFLGTCLLLAVVTGSGLMGEALFPLSKGFVLLVNALATAACLGGVATVFGPISGAHFNPLVTLGTALFPGGKGRETPLAADLLGRVAAQTVGAIAGVGLAHLMFDKPVWALASQHRSGAHLLISEVLASFSLLLLVQGIRLRQLAGGGLVIGAWVLGAYWFTSSTAFANPAATWARLLSDSFVGIHPLDVLPYNGAQLLGGILGAWVGAWLFREG